MIDCYSGFAYIYDTLMKDYDYNYLTNYIEKIFERYEIKPDIILDLACGTGTLCINLAQKGYDMIGLDISTDMLNVAQTKTRELGLDVLYINQNMIEFELYGTVDAIICTMDSINYIQEKDELIKLFKNIRNYLNPGGIFIFDINTEYRLKKIFGQNIFIENGDEIFYTWKNNYDNYNNVCEFDLTFFIRQEDKYVRIDEFHVQKAYTIDELKQYLNEAKLKIVDIFDNLSFNEIKDTSEKVFFAVKV